MTEGRKLITGAEKTNETDGPEKPEERETVTVEELALSNAYQLEAMLNVMERKDLLTSKEVLDALEVVAQTQGRKEMN